MKTLEKNIRDLKRNGILKIEKALPKKKCNLIKSKLDNIITKFHKNNLLGANKFSQVIVNPFRHDFSLIEIINFHKVDEILKKALDDNYVMVQCSVNNRKIREDLPERKSKNPGADWHTDSRYLGGEKISPGFGYLVILMLDDFTKDNSATRYVKKSHLTRNIPIRNGNYNSTPIVGEQGSIVIMDSGMWHRAGDPTYNSRWSMFNLYGGWFMKPYYRYWDMLSKFQINRLTKVQKRLLHINSVPPLHEEERFSTVTKL